MQKSKFQFEGPKSQQSRGNVLFSENVISYALYKNFISKASKVFFKVSHNLDVKTGRDWGYWFTPEVDVIEVGKNYSISACELKGVRQGRKRGISPENKSPDFPAFYDGIGQALAYLNLPYMCQNNEFDKFGGGAFDFVYLVFARKEIKFPVYEKRIFNLLPIGAIFALPNGEFKKVKEASQNPLQTREAKEHFLRNLDTLKKFAVNSKIFGKIVQEGERYFLNYET